MTFAPADDPRADRNDQPWIAVRRRDQAFRAEIVFDGLRHTHKHPFQDQDDAWSFLRRVRFELDRGRDLNLAYWETEPA